MKAAIELPDHLFRKAKATAAEQGQSLKEFVTQALRDKLALEGGRTGPEEPAWMQGFGKLKRLHKETVRVQSIVDQEFEIFEPEDRACTLVTHRALP
jgi:hypothetical protein